MDIILLSRSISAGERATWRTIYQFFHLCKLAYISSPFCEIVVQSSKGYDIGKQEIHNSSDVNVARVGESMTDVTDKSEYVETRETEPVDKAGWIVRRISELGGFENISDSVKADVFGFDIADVSGSIRLFSDVMKRLEIKLDGDELYEEFQRIYDKSVSRGTGKDKAEYKMWNRGGGR